MYGADYANNLRKNLLKPTDSGLLERPMKADLKIYKDRDDVVEDALADLLPYIDIKPQVRDEIAAKKAQADRAVEALKFLESGGKKNPYKTKGKKVTKGQYKGEQAIGAYGVMESNVPLFTKKYYGEELTVEEFINNTKAQDEVAKEFILQNYQKYGNLEDAISTWFTGDPLDQAMDRGADDGSIDIEEYMIRFNSKFNPR